MPLLPLTRHDGLSLHQLYEGCLFIGGTGSGKSSTAQHLMRALMQEGAGMLFLTAKGDDYAAIERVAAMAGRQGDLIRFATNEQWRFDFLNYELSAPGGNLLTAGQLMQDLVDFSTRTSSQNTNEPFWSIAAARKIRMAMILVYRATGQCTVEDVYSCCTSMATTVQELDSERFRKSFCYGCMEEAVKKFPDDHDLGLAVDFVTSEWPRVSEGRTGGSIDAHVINLLEKFVHGSVRELVASGVTNISPAALDDGKLIVIDTPVLTHREPGQFVQMVWKRSVQGQALRRIITPKSRPWVIFADESQLHALPSVDSMVQAVARSHLLIQVAITQSIPLLESVLKNREDVMAWVSNMRTWFMFANGDQSTNELCSARCGQSKQLLGGSSVSMGRVDPFDDWWGTDQAQPSYSMSEHWLPDVRPEYWSGSGMRRGGREHAYMVDVVIHQAGRSFSNGKPWIKTAFRQLV